jgi:hypothetical protein
VGALGERDEKAVGHAPALPQDRAAEALLACGPDAVLSHCSALALWGIL